MVSYLFTLTIIEKPLFSPSVAAATHITSVGFSGDATDGDFVMFHAGSNCVGASGAISSSSTLPRQALGNLSVSTISSLTAVGALTACYDTAESGGESDSDFAALEHPFMRLEVSPLRSIVGAQQKLDVVGGLNGDYISWTLHGNCFIEAGSTTPNKAYEHPLSGSTDNSFNMHTAANPGNWALCYLSAGYNSLRPGTQSWQKVEGVALQMVNHPTIDPLIGFVAVPTLISFTGSGSTLDGDFVVMLPGDSTSGDCSAAPSAVTGPTTLVSQLSGSQIVTAVAMDTAAELIFCVATAESGGDHQGDYAVIQSNLSLGNSGGNSVFRQRPNPGFTPNRTVEGALQKLVVSTLEMNDLVVWSTTGCDQSQISGVSSAQTVQYMVSNASATIEFDLHNYATAGSWQMCVKAANGAWALIPGQLLTIIAKPEFLPFIAFAGTSTRVELIGDNVDGDYVAMSVHGCGNAHDQTTGSKVLAKAPLINDRIYTDSSQDYAGSFVVCFATAGSGGDEATDFTTLTEEFLLITFTPLRSIAGIPNRIRVEGGAAGDQVPLMQLHSLLIQPSATDAAPLMVDTA